MKVSTTSVRFILALALIATPLAAFLLEGTEAQAQQSYFTSQGCSGCHSAPVVATCNGCHAHGTHPSSAKNSINVTGTTNKASFAPGETVTVTIAGGYRTGWFRAVLYDQNTVMLAKSTGNDSGMGSSATYPATLSAPAPTAPGSYSWKVAWYGNKYDKATPTFGAGWTPDPNNPNHGYEIVSMAPFTVTAPVDTTPPVVGTFTLPTTATSLTVPVSSFTATDNVAVTGYLITTSATAPAAGAVGWSASIPATATAPAPGSVTFYAWAKDAAGNVSAGKSASVTITLPDSTAPVVGAFTLPTTATSLTVPVSSFTATDNVAVTGYLITTSATAPSAGAVGWSASIPATATAPAAGSVTFYAWAKDAAGNVSNPMSATVIITLDTAAPTVDTFTLPATAATLRVPVTAFTASDNVAVTGYLVTTSAGVPSAGAVGWSAGAPTTVIAAAAGSVTFYAWAKDAADNVSAGKNATVDITIDLTKIMPGDVNSDSVVNVFDALLTLQYSVGLYQPPDLITFMAAADVAPLDVSGRPKSSGVVDVFDALAILRHAVGLDTWATTVPNVVGQNQAAAIAALSAAVLKAGTITTAASAVIPSGSVISQNPLAAASVVSGTAVNLIISSGPTLVTVPSVVGKTQAVAESDVTSAGLAMGAVTTAASSTVPIGSVISQNPLSGVTVTVGTSVSLVVSAGSAPVTVPNVVNQSQSAAQSAITGVGLVVGAVTTATSSSVPSGSVISQNPQSGTLAAAGSAVSLVVSSGPAQITVPNVVGQTTAAVQTAVSAAGLVVGTVTQQHDATVPGKVTSQSPSAGTIAAAGAAVSLTISSGPTPTSSEYTVVAWNDLGMHCLNPSFDTAVILPPYNTIWAQVIKRGTPPKIITSDISIDYRIINNTTSVSPVKGTFAQFWDTVFMNKLFGTVLTPDTGLNLVTPTLHNSLTGSMVLNGTHFQVNGIPVTPINDFGVKNPYQVAEITVKDTAGTVLAQTQATVPTSDEFSCGKCHNTDDPNPFKDMLFKHDRNQGTSLVSSMPVLCASCHGSPALNMPLKPGIKYLSEAIHGFHAVAMGTAIGCNDCHPGPTAKCNRSAAHSDITKVAPAVGSNDSCSNINCHGTLSKIASDISSGVKIPWVNEPKCVNCHNTTTGVDTGAALYRNSTGHGGLSCAACHSSPHAMYPVSAASQDYVSGNYQAVQYQGAAKTLGSCVSNASYGCHTVTSGRGPNITEEHGSGSFNGHSVSCGICHTGFGNPVTSNWPHGYTWKKDRP